MVESLLDILRHDQRVLAVYLLGSAARDQLRPDSDIDIALLLFAGCRIPPLELYQLAADLSMQAGRIVDVGILSSDNLVYAWQAIFTGERVFVKDTTTADLLVATLLGLYAQYFDERKEVVHAYSR